MKKIISILLVILTACSTEAVPENEPDTMWTCSNTHILFKASAYEQPSARICVDKVTGVKYLYVWDGAASGGPAITRYYEKE
jgi:hypothetical protein